MKIVLALTAAALAATGATAQTNGMTAKPAMSAKTRPAATATPATKTASAGVGRMVQHTTKTGKTITYDCSKKGNMNKTACKK